MLLISKTYEIVSPESAEIGDVEEQGFEFEDQPMSFRELVDCLKECIGLSSSPCSGSVYDWGIGPSEQDPFTGHYESFGYHYSHKNPKKNAKYWAKAIRAAHLR